MIQNDEKKLWERFVADGVMSRDTIDELGINPNRAHYILEKWEQKGVLDCGVNVENGWLVENVKKGGIE